MKLSQKAKDHQLKIKSNQYGIAMKAVLSEPSNLWERICRK